jgi:hypothetical protein
LLVFEKISQVLASVGDKREELSVFLFCGTQKMGAAVSLRDGWTIGPPGSALTHQQLTNCCYHCDKPSYRSIKKQTKTKQNVKTELTGQFSTPNLGERGKSRGSQLRPACKGQGCQAGIWQQWQADVDLQEGDNCDLS